MSPRDSLRRALADTNLTATIHASGERVTAITLDHNSSAWMGYHQPDGCDDSEHADNRRRFRATVREILADGHPGDVEIHATQDDDTWLAEALEDGAGL